MFSFWKLTVFKSFQLSSWKVWNVIKMVIFKMRVVGELSKNGWSYVNKVKWSDQDLETFSINDWLKTLLGSSLLSSKYRMFVLGLKITIFMKDQDIYGLIFETRVNDKLSCQIFFWFSTSDSIYPKNEEVIKIEFIQFNRKWI